MLQPNTNLNSDFMVFTGNANPVLAAEVAYELDVTLGLADVGRFSDGEVRVELKQNVRARDVFVIQSTCAPTNENMMRPAEARFKASTMISSSIMFSLVGAHVD